MFQQLVHEAKTFQHVQKYTVLLKVNQNALDFMWSYVNFLWVEVCMDPYLRNKITDIYSKCIGQLLVI